MVENSIIIIITITALALVGFYFVIIVSNH